MPQVLLLTALSDVAPDDNAALLAPAFRRRGWTVATACIDDLFRDRFGVCVDTPAGTLRLAGQDLLWVLGFGRRSDFLDKMQLLASAAPPHRWVNRIEALLLLHGKYPGADDPRFPHPPTLAADDPAALARMAMADGGHWVLKPPGGSFGRDVHRLDADAPDFPATLARLMDDRGWRVLQRYCPEVEAGEHRVLVAGGEVIGSYRRLATGGASNLARGGTARPAGADPARDALARAAAAWLAERGVAFAGLDLAGPWVLEANIVNPGGLATLRTLEGIDLGDAVVRAVLAARGGRDAASDRLGP